MRTWIRSLTRVVTAVFVVAGVLSLTQGVAHANHTVSVTPSTNLVHNQLVTVTYSGAEPNSTVGIFECRSTLSQNGECEIRAGFPASAVFPTDANGAGSIQFEVHQNYDGNGACMTVCYIKVNVPSHTPTAAIAQIEFAPPDTNEAPVADAGADQVVASGSTVQLDGSGSSDIDGDALTYAWSQVSGPAVALSGASSSAASFSAPTGPASLTFQLEVCDGAPLCDTDSVVIDVTSPSVAPVLQPIDVVVSAGNLTASCNAPGSPGYPLLTCATVHLSGVTADGSEHTATGAAETIYVSDNRAQAVGWSLSAQMLASPASGGACNGGVEFCNSSATGGDAASPNSHIPAANLSIGSIVCAPFAGNANPAPTAGGGGALNVAQTLCTAAAGSNTGSFTMDAQYSLLVPASALAGTYVGNVQYLVA